MKKPKYLSQMYSFIFLCIGVAFLISGLLVATGLMQHSKHSMVQDKSTMTLIFCIIGTVFCIVSAVFIIIARKKEKQHNELISKKRTVTGTVVEVQYKRSISFGKLSPYVICFSYSLNGENYSLKSHLIWEKPHLTVGNRIEVYADDFGKSTVII